ncbi:hypothetical protein Tco_1501635 [Tanacetum coccineum]
MQVFLFRCSWKKVLNLLKKGLLVRVEAMESSKRRRSKLDYRIQQLSKCISEGSGINPEVPDEPKDNSGSLCSSFSRSDDEVKNVSSDEENKADENKADENKADAEIHLIVDVPIHQEDPSVQRPSLVDTVILIVTEKTASTPTPPTIQAQVQMCSISCWKDSSREAWNALLVEGTQRQTDDCCRG